MEVDCGLDWASSVLQEDDLVVHFFWGFGFGYGFKSFYALAYAEFLLVHVDYAWVLSLGCHA